MRYFYALGFVVVALVVATLVFVLSSDWFAHFWNYFFWGGKYPITPSSIWYERNVWGNVVAILPVFGLTLINLFYHRRLHKTHEAFNARFTTHKADIQDLHDVHAEQLAAHGRHLKALLDALDPDTDGGIGEIRDRLDFVADKVDETTPTGIGAILARLEAQKSA